MQRPDGFQLRLWIGRLREPLVQDRGGVKPARVGNVRAGSQDFQGRGPVP